MDRFPVASRAARDRERADRLARRELRRTAPPPPPPPVRPPRNPSRVVLLRARDRHHAACDELAARFTERRVRRISYWPPPRPGRGDPPLQPPPIQGPDPIVVPPEDFPQIEPAQFYALFARPRREIYFSPPDMCGVMYEVQMEHNRRSYGVDCAVSIDIILRMLLVLIYCARRDMREHFPAQHNFQMLTRVVGDVWSPGYEAMLREDNRIAMPGLQVNQLFNLPPQANFGAFRTWLDNTGALNGLEERLNAMVQTMTGIQGSTMHYRVRMLQVVFFPIQLRNLRGRCNNKASNVVLGRHLLWKPYSAKNLCFFAIMLPAIGRSYSVGNALDAGNELGFNPRRTHGVSLANAERFAKHHGIGLKIVTRDDIVLSHTLPANELRPTVTLELHESHYSRVVENRPEITRCPRCGRVYRWRHDCNENRAAYYMRRFKEIAFVKQSEIEEEPIDLDSVLFFDIETLKDQWWTPEREPDGSIRVDPNGEAIATLHGTGRMEPYAVGAMCGNDAEPVVFWGPKCMQQFFTWMKWRRPAYVCAYNGSKFDVPIMLRFAHEEGRDVQDLLVHNGRIISGTVDNISFFDLFLFLTMPLRQAAESFKIKTQKGLAPHLLLDAGRQHGWKTPWEMLDYDGPWPGVDAFFARDHKDAAAFLASPDRPLTLNLRKEFTAYLESDVKALRELFMALQSICAEHLKTNLTRFRTGPQMAYELWRSKVQPDTIEIPVVAEKAQACAGAYFGGLVRPLKLSYKSTQYEDFAALVLDPSTPNDAKLKAFDELTDFLSCQDKNSMYPFVMLNYDYPTGISRQMTAEEIAAPPRDALFVIHLEHFQPPPRLFHPILPRRTKEQLLWSLEPGDGWYTSVDYWMAIDAGYQCRADQGWIWPGKARIFQEAVSFFMKMKEDGGRPDPVTGKKNLALRNLGKMLANSLYGKFGQKATLDKLTACYDMEDVNKFLMEYTWREAIPVAEGVMYMSGSRDCEPGSGLTKPMQVAAFVTAYARLENHKVRLMLDPTLGDPTKTDLYTDTDCFYLRQDAVRRMEELGLIGKEVGKYSEDLTKLMDGSSDARVLAAIFLRPKLKRVIVAFKIGDKIVIKSDFTAKGIPEISWEEHVIDGQHLEVRPNDSFFDRALAAYEQNGQSADASFTYDSLLYTNMNASVPLSHFQITRLRSVRAGWAGRVYNPIDGYWYPIGWDWDK